MSLVCILDLLSLFRELLEDGVGLFSSFSNHFSSDFSNRRLFTLLAVVFSARGVMLRLGLSPGVTENSIDFEGLTFIFHSDCFSSVLECLFTPALVPDLSLYPLP